MIKKADYDVSNISRQLNKKGLFEPNVKNSREKYPLD
jgi:hypothetical protein